MVTYDSILTIGQVEQKIILILNWIVGNRTFLIENWIVWNRTVLKENWIVSNRTVLIVSCVLILNWILWNRTVLTMCKLKKNCNNAKLDCLK